MPVVLFAPRPKQPKPLSPEVLALMARLTTMHEREPEQAAMLADFLDRSLAARGF